LFESAQKIGLKEISLCENMNIAVYIAKSMAQFGDTVLLSPASASFDAFSGYEERGDKFQQIIRSFQETITNNAVEGMEVDCEEQAE
jgi:UDP-N-acetylmuramoylalanine--D-glutamate ligase